MPVWVEYILLHASHVPLIVEGLVLILTLLAVWLCPALCETVFGWVEARFSSLARRQILCLVLVFFGALSLRAAFLPFVPVGVPEVQDEFSYLLAADTFASGRLTNPTHPMWEHFETMHVIHQPTYQSKYPPGQGLVLAAGMRLANHPWIGVWISCAFMCAALCWMFQGWLRPPWALLGTLLIMVRFCTVHKWSTGYWGGAVAVFGGALVVGALGRLLGEGKAIHAGVLGLGLVILANSRPFEGFLLAMATGGILLVWIFSQKQIPRRKIALRVVLPLIPILAAGGIITAMYCKAVTGHPFTLPYQVHMETYEAARPFLWQSPDIHKSYRHAALEEYWVGYHLKRTQSAQAHPFAVAKRRTVFLWFQLVWPGLIWPLLFIPFCLKSKDTARLAVLGASMVVAGAMVTQFYLHYLAPMLGVFYALILVGMERMRSWSWRGRPWGKTLGRMTVVVWVLIPWLLTSTMLLEKDGMAQDIRASFRFQREAMEHSLESTGTKHLVMVPYDPERSTHEAWVYNKADIDQSTVVWAREMDPARNTKLLSYFADRSVWQLQGQGKTLHLVPYSNIIER